MAPTRSSHTWTALALAGIAGFIGPSLACDKGKKDAPQPGASEPSAAKGNPDKPAVAASGPPRCDDFFTKDEIKALGLNAERYSEVASTNDAVTCTLGGVSAVIWRADRYSSIVDGITANGEKTGVAVEDGPKIGAQTQWTTMAGVHGIDGKSPHTVNFLSPSKKFTAAVSGTDKAKVEQVANALLAKFEKP
jgi:hypothetical protein